MLRRLAMMSVLALGAMSCSEESSTPTVKENEKSGDIRQSQVWKDGTKLTGLIRVFEGSTIEIEPGATVTCVEAVQIQVGGVLRVKGGGNHAKITCPRWRGILVAQGGQLDVEGLEIENAEVGVETTPGATNVELRDSVISASPRPFLVRANSKLSLTKVKASTPTTLREFESSVSEVFGTLTAKFLEYNANTNEGIMVMRDGEADIEDSTLKGTQALDLVSSYGGKALKVRYTTLNGGHCGPHIAESKDADKVPTQLLELDHISSEQNTWGLTIYALSMEGKHFVRSSNLQGDNSWLDIAGAHGPIEFTGNFVTGDPLIGATDPPTFAHATARIEDAKPRGQ